MIGEGRRIPVRGIRVVQLQAKADVQAIGVLRHREQSLERCRQIRIAISRDLNEDRRPHHSTAAMERVWRIGPTS